MWYVVLELGIPDSQWRDTSAFLLAVGSTVVEHAQACSTEHYRISELTSQQRFAEVHVTET